MQVTTSAEFLYLTLAMWIIRLFTGNSSLSS